MKTKVLAWLRSATKHIAVELVGRLLFYSGVLYAIALTRQFLGRRRLLVPMYHRVSPPGASGDAAILDMDSGVPADRFQQQVRVMSWFGPFVTLEEGWKQLGSPGATRGSAVAITFDDGYRDNLEFAQPVLHAYRARATIFPVLRSATGGRPLWWDELSELVRQAPINGQSWRSYLDGLDELRPGPNVLPGSSASKDRASIGRFLCGRLLMIPMQRREELLDRLRARLHVSPNNISSHLYLNCAELRDMAEEGWEIGGHTIDHPVLTAEMGTVCEQQVSGGRRALEQTLGTAVRSFAYPNNAFSDSVCAVVERAGYSLAVTVEPGINYRDGDRFRLRRIPIGDERPFELALKLAFYGWVHR